MALTVVLFYSKQESWPSVDIHAAISTSKQASANSSLKCLLYADMRAAWFLQAEQRRCGFNLV